MPTMPEALLLVALHDEKGTVHPSAFMAIDYGLRGALLAELRERGLVATRKGRIKWLDTREIPRIRMLAHGVQALHSAESPGTVHSWLEILEREMPDVQVYARYRLLDAGILMRESESRDHELETAMRLPTADARLEERIHNLLREGVERGEGISRRVGTLLALVQATNLTKVVFWNRTERKRARDLARWVMDNDSIANAVNVAAQMAQGTWEG